MKRNEALALTTSDINFNDGFISLNKTLVASERKSTYLQDNTKTKAWTRHIPIASQLMPVLITYCKDKVGIMFESRYGGYMSSSTFTKRCNTLLNKLKLANNGYLSNELHHLLFVIPTHPIYTSQE